MQDKGNNHRNHDLKTIRRDLEKSYGKEIRRAADCEILSLKIQEKTNKKISSTTLRRLFGLLNTDSKPSLYTIEVLQEYLRKK